MQIRAIEKRDYDYIVSVLDRWWGGPSGQHAEPFFLYEFGAHSLVAERDGQCIGFLLGFVTPKTPALHADDSVAYVHLVGIDPAQRRQGVGQKLYQAFCERSREFGATEIKAIAPVGNRASVHFHVALGFSADETEDYAGPGRGRMVFRKIL